MKETKQETLKELKNQDHYSILREKMLECVRYLDNEFGQSRDKSLSLTKIQESILWLDNLANKNGWQDGKFISAL